MYFKSASILCLFFSIACNNNATSLKPNTAKPVSVSTGKDNPYKHIYNIPLPEGFTRTVAEPNSFGSWLRKIELKKNTTVYLFNGQQKSNQSAQFAVVDLPVGNKNLQQCADVVMRLRAEYLFAAGRFSDIDFKDNANKDYHFMQPYNKVNLNRYLEQVFGMCGSASLSKQLKPVAVSEIECGDVFIRGGFPGHAVTVVDVAQNAEGKKIYLLAQGYMPAQDIHILKNPNNTDMSPWYEVNSNTDILTPEYLFHSHELKKW